MRAWVLALLVLALPGCAPAASPAEWQASWRAYKKDFLSPDGRIVDPLGQVTTSEGQAYGMFFALVADDRASFDRLLAWTQANLAGGDLTRQLPAWRWGQLGGERWGVLDENSASDADLWMAYALLEAERLWKQPRHGQIGRALLALIARDEVLPLPPWGPTLMLGRVGSSQGEGRYLLNPSYLPLPLLLRLAEADPAGPWQALADALPAFLAKLAPIGLAPDWVIYNAAQQRFEAAPSGRTGSYDAIRVYLWAGLSHPDSPGAAAIAQTLRGMAQAVARKGQVPREVDPSDGSLRGQGPVGFSAAMLPLLGQLRLPDGPLRQDVLRQRQKSGLYGQPAMYYDQNLALFALGHLGGVYRFDVQGRLQRTGGAR